MAGSSTAPIIYSSKAQKVDTQDWNAGIAAWLSLVSSGNITTLGNITVPSNKGFIRTSGTSSQFLKADGSVDSTAYLTAESDTLATVTNRGNVATGDMFVPSGNKIGYEGSSGDTHTLYNSTSGKLEFYVNNVKTMEI